ncbi:phosphatidylserine decarboxylase [Bacillus sp. JCM 19034]|uniref:phosphatidylserine decarboxylase n=1 Tax=Bacillus sp. JCM 19034 TaxID=1481928 RepID=UPI000784E862|nr:phosphatidylserine decarboxylase [Bacillus sp. JCM 19034]
MKKFLFRLCVELTNHYYFSIIIKKFTTSSLSKPLIPHFVRTFNVNENEMDRPLLSYNNLHELFTRKLKDGSRTIDKKEESVISPVDGVVAKNGKIREGETFFIKGQHYRLEEMLGSLEKASKYKSGYYMIIYLSPSHYHRIHAPITATVLSKWALGKRSYPVNDIGLKYGKRPLSRNYRVITEVKTNIGKDMAIVKVGAMNINSIELTHHEETIQKGEELGYFSFGSTVVLLAEEGLLTSDGLKEGRTVFMGERIGYLKT